VEIARTIENVRPETSHNKMLPLALVWNSFVGGEANQGSICFSLRRSKKRQGIFLGQARQTKAQERRQHETLMENYNKCIVNMLLREWK
jgi:hypothetical protein